MEERLDSHAVLGPRIDFIAVALDLHLEELPFFQPDLLLQLRDLLPSILRPGIAHHVPVRAGGTGKSHTDSDDQKSGCLGQAANNHAILLDKIDVRRRAKRSDHTSNSGAR